MQLDQIGIFVWQFALAMLPSSAWLAVCRLLPVLHRSVSTSYLAAILIVLLSCVLTRLGLTPIGLSAGALALLILITRWHHALKRRSLETSTIISFHHHDDT